MKSRLDNLVAATVVLALSGCAAPEPSRLPTPALAPFDLYGATAALHGDPAFVLAGSAEAARLGEIPARAVLYREQSGPLMVILHGYAAEAGGVRIWDSIVSMGLYVEATSEGRLVLSDYPGSSGVIELPNSLAVAYTFPHQTLGSPSLTFVIEQDGSFSGELAADLVHSETGEEHRVVATFHGVFEAVECDSSTGTEPVVVGGVSLPCTGDEHSQTLGQPPRGYAEPT